MAMMIVLLVVVVVVCHMHVPLTYVVGCVGLKTRKRAISVRLKHQKYPYMIFYSTHVNTLSH